MLYLDLDEAPRLLKGRWLWSVRKPALLWMKRSDHMGDPERPLADCVRERVASDTGREVRGPVRLLTTLRSFGYGFNPVSFYFVYEENGHDLRAVVSEVNNTPWGEQHCYVHPWKEGGQGSFRFRKDFHVSPFMPMDVDYEWRFSAPGNELNVTMICRREDRGFFSARMKLQRRAISRNALAGNLLRSAVLPFKVIAAIYWQALRLWLKKAPFHTHPDKLKQELENPA